jgi:hypothetical protein
MHETTEAWEDQIFGPCHSFLVDFKEVEEKIDFKGDWKLSDGWPRTKIVPLSFFFSIFTKLSHHNITALRGSRDTQSPSIESLQPSMFQ